MAVQRKTKRCPFCDEEILADAVKCRYCKEFIDDGADALPVSRHAVKSRPQPEDKITPLLQYPSSVPNKRAVEPITVTPSALGLVPAALATVLFLALAIALMILPFEKWLERLLGQNAWTPVLAEGLHVFGVVFGVFVVLRLVWRILVIESIRYDLSADRIEWSRGVFNRKIDNIDMFRVTDLKLRRSLLDCLLGIGAVTLITRDETNPAFEFEKVRQPRRLYDFIKSASLAADRKQGVVHIE
jgi:membrane protein YdbS with pleckstrin-like domain